MFHVVKYRQLFIGTVKVFSWGGVVARTLELKRRGVCNKMACFSFDSSNGAREAICMNRRTYCNAGEKFFVSPKCRIARDLFRNSGYKLVRDKSTADKVIIRSFPQDCDKITFNLAATNSSGDLLLFHIQKDRVRNVSLNEEDFKVIKDYFAGLEGVTLLNTEIPGTYTAEFLPINDEYEEILTAPKGTIYPYMLEHEVPVQCPVEISVETLNVWRCCSDYEVLAKAICNSNWPKYPATLCAFILKEKPMVRYYGGRNMDLVLEQIGFDAYNSMEGMFHGRIIEPDDWNMLQDWAMERFGVGETGGYISPDTDCDSVYPRLVRNKIVVAPLKINEPLCYDNITALLK